MTAPNNGMFQPHLVTSSEEGFGRLRVDQGQTSLFEGREFRMVRKLSAGTYYPKFTSASGTSEGRIALAWEERP